MANMAEGGENAPNSRTERMRIQKILFPVDFSPSCVAMAPFVRKAALMFLARVTLLHVVELASSGFELVVRPLPRGRTRPKRGCSRRTRFLSAAGVSGP
jgi:hypothetical protein